MDQLKQALRVFKVNVRSGAPEAEGGGATVAGAYVRRIGPGPFANFGIDFDLNDPMDLATIQQDSGPLKMESTFLNSLGSFPFNSEPKIDR